MSAFGDDVKTFRLAANLSLRALGRLAHIDPGYLSRIEAGTQTPSLDVARALDRALGATGRLIAAVQPRRRQSRTPVPLGADDVIAIRATVADLVTRDTGHEGDHLHSTAVRAFRQYHGQVAAGHFHRAAGPDLQAALAELGELAGWLLFDADKQAAARHMLTEAVLTAQLAGDRNMELFVTDLLAMQALHAGRPQEALLLANRVAAAGGGPTRVAAMSLLRRGRALAELGQRTEALSVLACARGILGGGATPSDPSWTWWVHEHEVQLHEARALTALGDHGKAVDLSRRAVDGLPANQVRDQVIYRAWHLYDLVQAGAWAEAEALLAELGPRLATAGSPRGVALVRQAVDGADLSAPPSLIEAARDCVGLDTHGQ